VRRVKTPATKIGIDVEMKSTTTAFIRKAVRTKDTFTDFFGFILRAFTIQQAMKNHKELIAMRAGCAF
jgi:hypothetical protein